MKSNYTICHEWANGVRESDRNENVFYTSDRIIYSYGYHFPMGRIIDGVLWYNLQTYSNTTSKHQSYMRGAWGWSAPVVACAVPGSHGGYYSSYRNVFDPTNADFQAANFDAWKKEIDGILPALNKARKPEKYLNQIASICTLVKAFAAACGCKCPAWVRLYADAESRESVQEYARKEAKKAAARAAKIEREKAEKFENGEISSYESEFQIIRYNEAKNRFETSKGVQIPFEIGMRFYNALKNGTLQTGTKVLYYTINAIGSTIKVGCHNFKKSYILKYGKQFETATA